MVEGDCDEVSHSAVYFCCPRQASAAWVFTVSASTSTGSFIADLLHKSDCGENAILLRNNSCDIKYILR